MGSGPLDFGRVLRRREGSKRLRSETLPVSLPSVADLRSRNDLTRVFRSVPRSAASAPGGETSHFARDFAEFAPFSLNPVRPRSETTGGNSRGQTSYRITPPKPAVGFSALRGPSVARRARRAFRGGNNACLPGSSMGKKRRWNVTARRDWAFWVRAKARTCWR